MDDVVILEATNDMNNGVHFTNIGQELVAESFTLTRSLDQAGDIDKLHPCGNGVGAFAQIRQLLQPPIRNGHGADIRFDGAEREIGCLGLGIGHEGIEESGFTHIG